MALPSFEVFSSATRDKVRRGDEMGAADAQIMSTGYPALDAQLPGGGWPIGAMTELLQPRPDAQSWQLVLPGLAGAVEGGTGPVAVIGAPHEPFCLGLAAGGLSPDSLLWIRAEPAAQRLWACEQALRCADVLAVMAWLPLARADDLRRLQLVAAQHESLLFVLRPASAAALTSPARLRLHVASSQHDQTQMEILIVKRRGPTLNTPVQVPAMNERMRALLHATRMRNARRAAARQHTPADDVFEDGTVIRLNVRQGRQHLPQGAGAGALA